LKCRAGDLAVIKFSIRPENIGRIVKVVEYVGQFQNGEAFQFRGVPCKCIVSDHYWWIEANDLKIGLGPSPTAYIADSWLEPIKPDKEAEEEQVDLEVKV